MKKHFGLNRGLIDNFFNLKNLENEENIIYYMKYQILG